MSKISLLVKNSLTGKARIREFALNNICTAKCSFCSIWRQQAKYQVDTDKALAAVSKLAGWGVNFITFTGGEPLLHPDFSKILQRCTDENIISSILAADARLFTTMG